MIDRPTFSGKSPYLLLGFVVLVLDQWSKWLIEEKLGRTGSVEVIPDLLNFIHVRNTGVAFGLFASHGDRTGTLILAGLGLLALAFVLYYFYVTPRWDRLLLVALGSILGGAVGNLIDRLAQGGVTDFIDFYFGTYHWHTFNIADSAITIGIGLMLLSTFRQPPETAEMAETAETNLEHDTDSEVDVESTAAAGAERETDAERPTAE